MQRVLAQTTFEEATLRRWQTKLEAASLDDLLSQPFRGDRARTFHVLEAFRHGLVSRPKDQGRTLRALGLHRIRQSVEHEDRPEIRGMIRKVAHLVAVTELDSQPVRPTVHRRAAGGGRGA